MSEKSDRDVYQDLMAQVHKLLCSNLTGKKVTVKIDVRDIDQADRTDHDVEVNWGSNLGCSLSCCHIDRSDES